MLKIPDCRIISRSAMINAYGGRAWRSPKCDGLTDGRATKKGNRSVFVVGFPKNERSNIDKGEEVALKLLAAHLLSLTKQGIDTTLAAGELMEIDCHAQNQISDT